MPPELSGIMEKGLFAVDAIRVATVVWWRLRRRPLPQVIASLGTRTPPAAPAPPRIPKWVDRSLRLGPIMPRCLIRSLVLYHYLRGAGVDAEVVIGLPDSSKEAHSWVEVRGIDVGPPPGKGTHRELVRYPQAAT